MFGIYRDIFNVPNHAECLGPFHAVSCYTYWLLYKMHALFPLARLSKTEQTRFYNIQQTMLCKSWRNQYIQHE